jgi:hypothetical protein
MDAGLSITVEHDLPVATSLTVHLIDPTGTTEILWSFSLLAPGGRSGRARRRRDSGVGGDDPAEPGRRMGRGEGSGARRARAPRTGARPGPAPAVSDENSSMKTRHGWRVPAKVVEFSSPGDENPAMVRLGL